MSVYRVGTNKSSTNVFPSIRPTLDLDFANTKTLDPRITFTRASGGSYVGADGLIKYAGVNEARFDHDPVTGESLGLLIEEARTNLLSSSDNFMSGSGWGTAAATREGNIGVSPDGTTTADKIISTGGGVFRAGIPVSNSTAYTYSIFIKYIAGNGRISAIGFERFGSTVVNATINIDLISGTILSSTANVSSSSILSYPNGWYRVSVTTTSVDTTATVINYTSISGNEYLLWGAQLEAGAFPTSYIPTQASTRTRAADNASITGKNFSSWYRQDEGTVFCEVTHGLTNYRAMFYSISRGLTNSYNIQYYKEPLTSLLYNSNTTNQDFIGWNSYGTTNYKNYVKTVRTYRENELIHSINGAIFTNVLASGFGTRTIGNYSAKSPTGLNRLTIGNHPTIGASHQNGTIKRFTYYSKVLPPSQIQALTR
jgi:hypothetical protein